VAGSLDWPVGDIYKNSLFCAIRQLQADITALRADNASLYASLQGEVNARGIPWIAGPPTDDLKDGVVLIEYKVKFGGLRIEACHHDGDYWGNSNVFVRSSEITRHCPVTP
jgi:hypothetical protein